MPAFAETCPNAALRTGPSASLPDCRAYELVTPADKGRTQDLTFSLGTDNAIAAPDGERIALRTSVPLGPNPNTRGSRAVFSRTATGWEMKSALPPASGESQSEIGLFTPDLSQVGLEYEPVVLNAVDRPSETTYEVGPVGGPYTVLASVPQGLTTQLLGASPDFSHVVLGSADHSLLPAAEGITAEGAFALYEWTGGHLRLVNVNNEGSLVSECGAMLGFGEGGNRHSAHNAVSSDGSKIFFTAPDIQHGQSSSPACEHEGEAGSIVNPTRLYMRVNGSETIQVSAPAPGVIPAEFFPVRYNGASVDGAKVFFNTETPLTADDMAPSNGRHDNELYEYETNTRKLTRISRGESGTAEGHVLLEAIGEESSGVVVSEDGSTVYFRATGRLTSTAPALQGVSGEEYLYRYDTTTGTIRYIATVTRPSGEFSSPIQSAYTTPNGEFLMFLSGSIPGEPRGQGHGEFYRYDNADGSVMCVSCGPGNAPAQGEASLPTTQSDLFGALADLTPKLIPMSADGRYVFFNTSAQLVPQDVNSTEVSGFGGEPGKDVYEWEADDAGGCELVQGCTHLISSGQTEFPSTFLGASVDGRDLFFATQSPLVPQDTDEFMDIYDARIDGGFASSPQAPECLSCQGVGSPPPLFSTPASVSFTGAGNPMAPTVKVKLPKKKSKKRLKKKSKRKARRKTEAARRAGKAAHASSGRKS
jgi:hypothetical protein